MVAQSLAIEVPALVRGEWFDDFHTEACQEWDQWFEVRMNMLHNEWCPRQVGLDDGCFEYTRLRGVEQVVEALCKIGFGFLLRGSIVKNADSDEDVKERLQSRGGCCAPPVVLDQPSRAARTSMTSFPELHISLARLDENNRTCRPIERA